MSKAESLEPTAALAAQEVSDGDLDAASGGRTVRIGVTANSRRPADIPIETYVARVLSGEGEPRAADAAQQALAIAIRTYAISKRGRHQREGFDLCDTTHCQVLRSTATPAARRAARATAGQVLLYEDRPADVYYSASCGGRSETASGAWPGMPDFPYLRSTKDDVHEDDTPWTLERSLVEIENALRRQGFEGRLRNLDIDHHTGSGRVATVHLSGMRPDEIGGDDLRAALGYGDLRSTAFTVKRTSTGFTFTGMGYGHGVGMCVIGAGRRAARGESAAEILARYYPGLTLTAYEDAVSRRIAPAPVSPVAPAAPVRTSAIVVRGVETGVDPGTVERLALAAHAALTTSMGVSVAPIAFEVHNSIESFRQATGRPWWVSAVVKGTTIDLAPPPVLAQRDGLEAALRVAVAEALVGETFSGRPAWLRIGAARFFGRPPSPPATSVPAGDVRPSQRGRRSEVTCPTDAELTMAVSAPAQREAEMRAEVCFARALGKVKDWRQVR